MIKRIFIYYALSVFLVACASKYKVDETKVSHLNSVFGFEVADISDLGESKRAFEELFPVGMRRSDLEVRLRGIVNFPEKGVVRSEMDRLRYTMAIGRNVNFIVEFIFDDAERLHFLSPGVEYIV